MKTYWICPEPGRPRSPRRSPGRSPRRSLGASPGCSPGFDKSPRRSLYNPAASKLSWRPESSITLETQTSLCQAVRERGYFESEPATPWSCQSPAQRNPFTNLKILVFCGFHDAGAAAGRYRFISGCSDSAGSLRAINWEYAIVMIAPTFEQLTVSSAMLQVS